MHDMATALSSRPAQPLWPSCIAMTLHARQELYHNLHWPLNRQDGLAVREHGALWGYALIVVKVERQVTVAIMMVVPMMCDKRRRRSLVSKEEQPMSAGSTEHMASNQAATTSLNVRLPHDLKVGMIKRNGFNRVSRAFWWTLATGGLFRLSVQDITQLVQRSTLCYRFNL
jgi:hypothetical protein